MKHSSSPTVIDAESATARVISLCDVVCRGAATSADLDNLNSLLADAEEARAAYLAYMNLHRDLSNLGDLDSHRGDDQ